MTAIDAGRHEYRMKGWLRALYFLLGLFLSGIGLFAAVMLTQETEEGAAAIVGVLPLAIGVYLLALVLRSRLVIDGTRIEVRGAFQEKSANLDEVEGFRTITTRNGSFWRLQLKEGRGSFTIQKWFDCDEVRAWFQQLTDLDEQDRKELLSEIEQNQELGATPEERLNALKRAKASNLGLTAIAVIAVAGLFLAGPQWRLPAAFALALVPAAVLYLLNQQPLLFALGKSRRDPRNELLVAFLTATMGLFFSGIQKHFVAYRPLLPAMAGVALLFVAGFAMMGRKGLPSRGFYGMVLVCAGFYSFGVIAECDTLLDHGKATPCQAQVTGKHTAGGRSTTYYLDFAAWGPFNGENKVSVPVSLYEAAETGDTVCFDVYPGALHAAWFERVDCSPPQKLETMP